MAEEWSKIVLDKKKINLLYEEDTQVLAKCRFIHPHAVDITEEAAIHMVGWGMGCPAGVAGLSSRAGRICSSNRGKEQVKSWHGILGSRETES